MTNNENKHNKLSIGSFSGKIDQYFKSEGVLEYSESYGLLALFLIITKYHKW